MIYTADLGPISVEETEHLFSVPPVAEPLEATFGSEIALLGYDLAVDEGGTGDLTLVWQALEKPAADYTVFVHVLDENGTCCIWQQDGLPSQNQYPTSRWLLGEVVLDPYEISLPDDLAPGQYAIEVGLYIAETGRRLLVELPGQVKSDKVLLRPIQITAR
jgi:hypothetical protein